MDKCEQWVEIKASAAHALAAFDDPSYVPRWMGRVINVLVIDERHSFWLMEAVEGTSGRWVAEKVESAPNRSAYFLNEGCARALLEAEAIEARSGVCRLRFVVSDRSPISWRGAPGPVILFGEDVAAELQRSLQRFKTLVEVAGALPVEAGSRVAVDDAVSDGTEWQRFSISPADSFDAATDATQRELSADTVPRSVIEESAPTQGKRSAVKESCEDFERGATLGPVAAESFAQKPSPFVSGGVSDGTGRSGTLDDSSRRRSAFPWVHAFVFFAIAFSSGVLVWFARQATLMRSAQTHAESAPESIPDLKTDKAAPALRAENTAPSPTAADELRAKVTEWAQATNRGDLDELMRFYAPVLDRYYLQRGVARASVRADKARYLSGGQHFRLEIAMPRIVLSPDGRRATMTFLKRFNFAQRRGVATQQLIWERNGDWQIVSERDLAVR